MIDFSKIKEITLPEGKVSKISINNVTVWETPHGYKKRLKCLVGTGEQYIDTGLIISTASDTVQLVFQALEENIYKWFFGEHDNNARLALGSGDGVDTRNLAYGSTTKKVSDSKFYNSTHVFYADTNGVFLDNVKELNFSKFTSNSTIYLFDLNLGSGNYKSKVKIWSYKHTRNGTLICDLIPVLDFNDVACFYDNVSKKLFYNKGTGEFDYE